MRTSRRGVGQALGDAAAPLDDGDRLVERGVEVEVVELADAAEAVGVDVHEAGPPVSDGCTRAITNVGEVTSPRTPSPAAETLGERRLAGAQLSREHDQVAGAEQPADHPPEVAHGVGVGSGVGARDGPPQLDVRRPARRSRTNP